MLSIRYDYEFQSHVAKVTATLICSLHISSRAELKAQEKNLQSGGQYGIISGFFDAAESSTGQSTEYVYDQMCNKNNYSFISDVFSSKKSTITNNNVDAWKACVLNQHGLFTALSPSADGKTYSITFNYLKPNYNTNKLELKDVDKSYGFKCSIDNVDINGFIPEDHNYHEQFSVTCVRDSDALNDKLVINTSEGTAEFDVPGKPLTELSGRVEGLDAEVSKLKNATHPPQVDLISCRRVFDPTKSEPWWGGQQIVVSFTPKDCANSVPKQGWKYTANLIKAVFCGALPDYEISTDPLKPSIHFYGIKPCTTQGEVYVDWIGFNPAGF
jgi:hypothetical protein